MSRTYTEMVDIFGSPYLLRFIGIFMFFPRLRNIASSWLPIHPYRKNFWNILGRWESYVHGTLNRMVSLGHISADCANLAGYYGLVEGFTYFRKAKLPSTTRLFRCANGYQTVSCVFSPLSVFTTSPLRHRNQSGLQSAKRLGDHVSSIQSCESFTSPIGHSTLGSNSTK